MIEVVDKYMRFQWTKFKTIAITIAILFNTPVVELQWMTYILFNITYVTLIYVHDYMEN